MSQSHHQLKDRIREVFDRASPTYDQVGPHFFSHFGRNLVALAKPRPGSRVLDVATGSGAVLFHAADAIGPSGSIAGIDLSPEMVKRTQLEARQRAMQNVTVECMDAEELQFSDCSFDTVFCGLSLSFFPDLGKTLTGFKRVLKPGGTLAVSIWGPGDARWIWLGDVYEKFQPFFLADPNITPVHFHEASTLETALREAGFQNIRIMEDRKEFVYLDFDEWWAAQWSHVNRAVLESLPPEVMNDFKEDLSRHIKSVQEPDGIHQVFCVVHALAVK